MPSYCKAAMTAVVLIYLNYCFYVFQIKTKELMGHMVLLVQFFEQFHIACHFGYTNIHSH